MSDDDFNRLLRRKRDPEAEQRAARDRLFGAEPEPAEPPTKPQGSADGGVGEPENFELLDSPAEPGHARQRSLDAAALMNNREDSP